MQQSDIGLIGLGVMGRNLILNMADRGFAVAGYDLKKEMIARLKSEKTAEQAVFTADSIPELSRLLRKPRAMILLVPAGDAVDQVVTDLLPVLDENDLIIDGGNSHFTDTDRRAKTAAERGIRYLGLGISGGEAGARHGPSMMPGGSKLGYARVRPILEAAAAKVGDVPCAAYLGPGSAGHYVKMVHNGIEYGVMQLLAETYDLMQRGLGYTAEDLARIYDQWNREEFSSYLMEITADIFRKKDDRTGDYLMEKILDCADQKGTGMWMACDALGPNLQVPIPAIDAAVQMRNLSMLKEVRRAASETLSGPRDRFKGDADQWVKRLGRALGAAAVLTYAQGMDQLRKASEVYGYGLELSTVARIWRGGCIIRAALLDKIMEAFRRAPDLPNLILDPELGRPVTERQADLRHIVESASAWGVPTPGFMMSLAYLDAFRSPRLPANLIQAQRDYFGSHGYKRTDLEGVFHTDWKQ